MHWEDTLPQAVAVKQCLQFRHAVLVYPDWLCLRDLGEFGVKRI